MGQACSQSCCNQTDVDRDNERKDYLKVGEYQQRIIKETPSEDICVGIEKGPEIGIKIKETLEKVRKECSEIKDRDIKEIEIEGKWYEYKDGSVYQGEFREGLRNGLGKLIGKGGEWMYIGGFDQDLMEGEGVIVYQSGDYYKGEMEKDNRQGVGQDYQSEKESLYWGEYNNNVREGKGKEQRREEIYEGGFIGGYRHGQGILKMGEGGEYKGGFMEGEPYGQGIQVYMNGNSYKGGFMNGVLEGEGEFEWTDGKKYKGGYLGNKKEGYGVFEWPDGRVFKGMWVQGEQHGQGEYTSTGGIQRTAVWKHGQRTQWLD